MGRQIQQYATLAAAAAIKIDEQLKHSTEHGTCTDTHGTLSIFTQDPAFHSNQNTCSMSRKKTQLIDGFFRFLIFFLHLFPQFALSMFFILTHASTHSLTHTKSNQFFESGFCFITFCSVIFYLVFGFWPIEFLVDLSLILLFSFSCFIHLSCLRHNNPHSQLKSMSKFWTMSEIFAVQMKF